MVDKRVLDVLVCPACRTAVRLEGERLVCRNAACGLRYPIRDDIPIMLIQEAEKPEGRGPATGSGQPASA
ncbi:MAG: Trm112 family protein [Planctomycetota bacterium]|nr:Trm112 family protein [Planctomycetota bacterium]